MPILKPKSGETKSDFVKRFMEDETMIAEYQDEAQRYALAESQFENAQRTATRYILKNETTQRIRDADAWVMGFPRGNVYIEKYDEVMKMDEVFFNEVLEAFKSEKLSKPFVDIDHDFGSSCGWVEDCDIREDGMYFKLNLTERGKELISKDEFRYISPAWGGVVDTDGNAYKNKLFAISLTNFPAFEGRMPTLQSQLYAASGEVNEYIIAKTKRGEEKMFEATKKILGLSKDASEESVIASLNELNKKIDVSANEIIELKKALTETETKKTEAENKIIELGKQIKEAEEASLREEAKKFVSECVQLGKIHPTGQDIYIERYIANKDVVIEEMKLIPEKEFHQLSQVTTVKDAVTDEIKADMEAAGLDPKNAEDVKIFTSSKKIFTKE